MATKKNITVDGIEYVRADTAAAQNKEGLAYVVVRCRGASPHAGYLSEYDAATRTAILLEARRLWRWYGAQTLSDLAQLGTGKPADCKFNGPSIRVVLTEVDEIVTCSAAGMASIQGVATWTA